MYCTKRLYLFYAYETNPVIFPWRTQVVYHAPQITAAGETTSRVTKTYLSLTAGEGDGHVSIYNGCSTVAVIVAKLTTVAHSFVMGVALSVGGVLMGLCFKPETTKVAIYWTVTFSTQSTTTTRQSCCCYANMQLVDICCQSYTPGKE